MKTALLATLICCLLLMLVVMSYSLTRKDRIRSMYFTVLCSSVGMYLLGYILEILSPTVEASVIALKVENAGIAMIAPFMLLFTLRICQYKWLRQWMVYLALTYGIAVFFTVLFNERHMLYYTSVLYIPVQDMHYMLLGHGPLYFLQQGVTVTCSLAAYVALGIRMRQWTPTARKQMKYIIVGTITATMVNIFYFTGMIPPSLDPTPIALTVAIVLCVTSVARHQLFDIRNTASDATIQSMDDAIVVLDSGWLYRFSNPSAWALFPGMEQLLGANDLTCVKNWPDVMRSCIGPGKVNFQLEQDGEIHDFRAHICAVGEGIAAQGWSIAIRDITETTRLLEQMKSVAITDSLTGIYNRGHFNEAANRELEVAKRQKSLSALAIFDLDHFKRINDTYGHQAGDTVLRAVADSVKAQMRPYDIFARYGGEEFALFICSTSIKDAESITQRLCRGIESLEIHHNGRILGITASFGLVSVPWDATLDDAVLYADKALYQAKNSGRNRVVIGDIGSAGAPVLQRTEGEAQ